MNRLARSLRGIRKELAGGHRWTRDRSSFLRYARDVLLYRMLRVVRVDPDRHERVIRTTGNGSVAYRLDRGDIRALAETFTLEAYRLPPGTPATTLVDLGANIGVVSIWFALRYGIDRIVAVEPLPANARMVRRNFALNGIQGDVIEAAVGARQGFVNFDRDERNSTVGRVSEGPGTTRVRCVSMADVLATLEPNLPVDVLKIDIEGAEAELFAGELDWLSRVRLIIAELHPNLIDVKPIVERLGDLGFEYRKLDVHDPDWLFGDIMALFVRAPGDPLGTDLEAHGMTHAALGST